MRMIEGVLMPGRPVVLVDDIMNSGSSFIRQVEVLHELGYKVAEVWCILRFRDEAFYTYFTERNIAVRSSLSSTTLPMISRCKISHQKT